MKFKVHIEPDEDGVFVATVPALPGCISQGKTEEEAVANIQEAIVLHLECMAEDGVSIMNQPGKDVLVEVAL